MTKKERDMAAEVIVMASKLLDEKDATASINCWDTYHFIVSQDGLAVTDAGTEEILKATGPVRFDDREALDRAIRSLTEQ